MGHEVTVVTTDAVPSYVSHLYENFGRPPEGVEVIRLKPIFTLGQILISRGVKNFVFLSRPDQIIVIGLGKRFPKHALGLGVHTTVLFGDNAASYGDSPSWIVRLLFELFKRGTYQRAIKKAERLVAYTPESFEAAGKMLGGKWAEKLAEQKDFISLGFHPDEFYFNESLRRLKRSELDYSDLDRVVITATRLRPEKNLEAAIPAFQKENSKTKWLILGSHGDDYAKQFREKLKADLGEDRFMLLPHQKREDLNAFYNAADIALFTTPAISIIEAMGTGLPVILPPEKSLSHLISVESQGIFVDDFADLNFEDLPAKHRGALAQMNVELFSWQKQAEFLICCL